MAYIDSVKDSVVLQTPSIGGKSIPSNVTETVLCGNLQCTGGWLQRWKNRTRPYFEGQWACSRNCLSQLVTQAVRREVGSSIAGDEFSPHNHRIPLGLVLMAQGIITPVQLQQALQRQRQRGHGRIGDCLMEAANLSEGQITRAMGAQWNCPMLTLEGFSPERMARLAPQAVLEESGMLPVRVAGGKALYLAFEAELNPAAALALEQMTDLHVHSGLLPSSQYQAARKRLVECKGIATNEETVEDQDSLVKAMVSVIEKQQPVASRLVRVGRLYWMRLWLEGHAVSCVPGESAEDVLDCVWRIHP